MYHKQYRSINLEKSAAYLRHRYNTDLNFRLRTICREMVRRMFDSVDENKCGTISDALGYTPKQLKEHIEKQFKPGMTWDNYGEWHIDHIIPISSAKSLAEGLYLSRLDNLQPLWAEENLSKGNKVLTDLEI